MIHRIKKLLYIICICAIQWGAHAQTQGSAIPDLKELNVLTDPRDVNIRNRPIPLIGISAGLLNGATRVPGTYIQAVLKAGGAPIVIPVITDEAGLRTIISNIDGLVISGGEDINPLWYGEQPNQHLGAIDPIRDEYDLKLIKLATAHNIPTLGICRGLQLMNVAFGGTLYQDIPSQRPDNHIKHKQDLPGSFGSHQISIKPGSRLADITSQSSLVVNSFHHQSIKELALGFKATAYATDSVIEAIEAWPNRPFMAVQWHPESMTAAGDTTMIKLFRFLVSKAEAFHKTKETQTTTTVKTL